LGKEKADSCKRHLVGKGLPKSVQRGHILNTTH